MSRAAMKKLAMKKWRGKILTRKIIMTQGGGAKLVAVSTALKPNSDGAKVKKEDSRFPKRFKSYREANKGVPRDVVAERLKAKSCTRCGKGPHNALNCQGEAVKTSSTESKEAKSTGKVAAVITAPSGSVKDNSCHNCSHATTAATAATV